MSITNWQATFFGKNNSFLPAEGSAYPFVRFAVEKGIDVIAHEDTEEISSCAKHFRCAFYIRANNSDDDGLSFSFSTKFALPYDDGKIVHYELKLTVLQDETGNYLSDAVQRNANSEFVTGIFSAVGNYGEQKSFFGRVNNENVRVPFCKNRWHFVCACVDFNESMTSADMRIYINGVSINLESSANDRLSWQDSTSSIYKPYDFKSYIQNLVVDIANFCTYVSTEPIEGILDAEFMWKIANQANGTPNYISSEDSFGNFYPIVYLSNQDGEFKINSVTGKEIIFNELSDEEDIIVIDSEAISYRTSILNSYVKFLYRNNNDSFTRFIGCAEEISRKLMFSFFVNFDDNFTESVMTFSDGKTNNYHEIHLRKSYVLESPNQIWWSGQQDGSTVLRRNLVKETIVLLHNKWNFVSGYIDLYDRSKSWFAVNDIYDDSGLINDFASASSRKFEGLLCFGTNSKKSYKISHFYFFTESIISAHQEIAWSDPSIRANFINGNKPKYGGVDGSEILGFKPYVYIDPSIGIGILSESATGNNCDLQTSKTDSAVFNKMNSYSLEDENEIAF